MRLRLNSLFQRGIVCQDKTSRHTRHESITLITFLCNQPLLQYSIGKDGAYFQAQPRTSKVKISSMPYAYIISSLIISLPELQFIIHNFLKVLIL